MVKIYVLKLKIKKLNTHTYNPKNNSSSSSFCSLVGRTWPKDLQKYALKWESWEYIYLLY